MIHTENSIQGEKLIIWKRRGDYFASFHAGGNSGTDPEIGDLLEVKRRD